MVSGFLMAHICCCVLLLFLPSFNIKVLEKSMQREVVGWWCRQVTRKGNHNGRVVDVELRVAISQSEIIVIFMGLVAW